MEQEYEHAQKPIRQEPVKQKKVKNGKLVESSLKAAEDIFKL